jgi:hypothetical protein
MNLLDYYKSGRRWVTRGPLDEITDDGITHCDDSTVVEAVKYFDRSGDLELIKTKAKSRFAIGIREAKYDTTNRQTQPEIFVRGDAAVAVDQGIYEMVPTGIGTRIVKATATLSTQPDANITFVDPDQEEAEEEFFGEGNGLVDTEQTQELINSIRERGEFDTAFEGLDFAASAVEVAYLHTYAKGWDFVYDTVLPYDIWFVHGKDVTCHSEGMEDIKRPADKRDINDASAVIIEMDAAANSTDNSVYLAYVGGCDGCPDGRMVWYEASSAWPIPKLEDAKENSNIISEYKYPNSENGTPCNPLTRILNRGDDNQKRSVTTEYPIVEWRGGYRTIDSSKIPVTTSLYEASLELELAWSRLLMHTQANSRGRDAFERDMAASGTGIPRSLEVMFLEPGIRYSKLFGGAAEGTTALEVLTNLTKQVAGGYNVPGYMIIEHGAIPESGAALAIQSRPIIEFRQRRYKVNKPKMAKQFEVERALLASYHGSQVSGIIQPTIKQVWDPGTWSPPQDEFDRLEEISYAEEKGYIDHVEAFRQANNLATIQEAEDKIDEMNERDPSFGTTQDMFGNKVKTKPPKGVNPIQEKDEEQDDGSQGATPKSNSGGGS